MSYPKICPTFFLLFFIWSMVHLHIRILLIYHNIIHLHFSDEYHWFKDFAIYDTKMWIKLVDLIMLCLDYVDTINWWLIFFLDHNIGLYHLWIIWTTSWHWDFDDTFKFDFGHQKSAMKGWLFVDHFLLRSYLVIIIGFVLFGFKTWHCTFKNQDSDSSHFQIQIWRERSFFLKHKSRLIQEANFHYNNPFHYKSQIINFYTKFTSFDLELTFWSSKLTKIKLPKP